MKYTIWKRLLALVLSLALALSLTACGGTADGPEQPVQSGTESSETESSRQPAADADAQSHPTDGIGAWLPPTDTGLAGTVWETEDDWVLELKGGADEPYAGEAVLSCRTADDGDMTVCYAGSWGVEDDCLRLDLKDADGTDRCGLYPVLISPSGEELNLRQSADGTVPPFFADGVTSVDLNYCYE